MTDFSDYANFSQNAFKNFTEAFDVSKMPTLNSEQFWNLAKKNLECVAKVAEIMSQNLQQIITKQSESLKSGMESFSQAAKSMSEASDPQSAMNGQQELYQNALKQNMQNAKEIAEAAAKANTEVMQVLTQHFQENIANVAQKSSK